MSEEKIKGRGVLTSHWFFESINEANLADALGNLAVENGISFNDLHAIFPMVLRMIKHESKWSE